MLEDFSISYSDLNILVVEDEPSTRSALIRALKLSGYQAEGAATGDEALERLASERYHLMLLDLRLPGLDGVAVMQHVKRDYPNTLVIMLTAHGTLDSAIAAIRAGAVDYLLKPCKLEDIEAAISRAVQTWRVEMRRKHLLDKMQGALEALREEEKWMNGGNTGFSEQDLTHGTLSLNQLKRVATVFDRNGKPILEIVLTDRESAILAYLMQRPDVAVSCFDLARFALGEDADKYEAQGIVRPHISRLRKKIEQQPSNPRLIRTIRGEGYLLSSDGLNNLSKRR